MASGLRQRIVTALALAAVVIGILFWMPPAAAVVAVAVAVLAGAWEWAGFAGLLTPLRRLGYTIGVGNMGTSRARSSSSAIACGVSRSRRRDGDFLERPR